MVRFADRAVSQGCGLQGNQLRSAHIRTASDASEFVAHPAHVPRGVLDVRVGQACIRGKFVVVLCCARARGRVCVHGKRLRVLPHAHGTRLQYPVIHPGWWQVLLLHVQNLLRNKRRWQAVARLRCWAWANYACKPVAGI